MRKSVASSAGAHDAGFITGAELVVDGGDAQVTSSKPAKSSKGTRAEESFK
jgi:hypothetical protein